MTSYVFANDTSRKRLLNSLKKLRTRKDLRLVMPKEGCPAVGTHLAGMLLIEHLDYLIELVEEDE